MMIFETNDNLMYLYQIPHSTVILTFSYFASRNTNFRLDELDLSKLLL